MSTTDDHFDMSTAPLRIDRVRLKVRDADAVSAFYQSVLGLAPMAGSEPHITLGTGSVPLLELVADASLAPHDPRQAGLFHTAFLLPSRGDLGRWLDHAMQTRVTLQGAADHIVSEALYLADPEGNGIEVYADRTMEHWHGPDGKIYMTNDPLDRQDLLNSAEGSAWSGFPRDGCIGHVHLQVGETATADHFYRDVLGLDITRRYPDASFYGSGGYHHQLAGNAWNSRNAASRIDEMVGLEAVHVALRDAQALSAIATRAENADVAFTRHDSGITVKDPWGTTLVLS